MTLAPSFDTGSDSHRGGSPRQLVCVRHGQTRWNAEERFQGHADPPLDAVGNQQAEKLAAAIIDDGVLGDRRVAAVASSDLRRALHTAEALGRSFGLAVTVDPALREVDVGTWEGLRWPEVAERFPEEWRAWRAGADVRRGGGETFAEAGERVAGALVRLRQAAPDGTATLVVGHGLALQAGLARLRDLGLIDLPGGPPHLRNAQWLAVSFAGPLAPRPAPGTAGGMAQTLNPR